jgi:hypothetical protein
LEPHIFFARSLSCLKILRLCKRVGRCWNYRSKPKVRWIYVVFDEKIWKIDEKSILINWPLYSKGHYWLGHSLYSIGGKFFSAQSNVVKRNFDNPYVVYDPEINQLPCLKVSFITFARTTTHLRVTCSKCKKVKKKLPTSSLQLYFPYLVFFVQLVSYSINLTTRCSIPLVTNIRIDYDCIALINWNERYAQWNNFL